MPTAVDGLYKRVMREMQDLKEYENIKELQLIFPFGNDQITQNQDTPYLKIKIDSNDLILTFNDHYPFKPPTLLINGEKYYKCYQISSATALTELDRKFGIKCMCCETVMCGGKGKWSPAIRVSNILDEYKRFRAMKRYLNSYRALLQLNACLGYMLPLEMIEIIRDFL